MLEVTDAFLDKDQAINLTTGVSEDVEHISDSGRLVIEPDKMFSSVLQSVIEAKYDKASDQALEKTEEVFLIVMEMYMLRYLSMRKVT